MLYNNKSIIPTVGSLSSSR